MGKCLHLPMVTTIRVALVVLVAAFSLPVQADPPEVDLGYELRLRHEFFDTPAANPAADRDYDFGNARFRFTADVKWERFDLRGVAQAAGSFGLPANGAFGIGPVYFAANDGDENPAHLGLAELFVTYRNEGFRLYGGRMKSPSGNEIGTGVAHLDGIKKRRLAERLVGNWDWVNVGRRYDGLGASWQNDTVRLDGWGFIPLAGGVNYEDAFEQLDDLSVCGIAVTGRYGQWLPAGELRLFAHQYDDDRPGARAAAGGELSMTTVGSSLLWGGEDHDLLAWVAWQTGDWGPQDHDALAFFIEGGRKIALGALTWTFRAGLAQASGGDPRDAAHGTFFNMLPTNHKFYGSLDYSAFQNLRDLYAEALITAGGPWNLRIAAHLFELEDTRDAWYGGSGAFDKERLGFAGRRPAGGFTDDAIGQEIDIDFGYKLPHDLRLGVGGGVFFGGDGAEQFLRAESDGSWGYVQLSWKG
ncbi:MAG: alginate export family protein [Acidobacteriota bacterium]